MQTSTLSPHNTSVLPRVPGRWLTFLCVILAGYALLGKGWAYLGVPPLFIGEMALLSGLVWFVLYGRLKMDLPAIWLLLGLAGWGAVCTLPYLEEYGIKALRDAAIWGYGAFAIIVVSYLLNEPRRLPLLLRRFRDFSIVFIWLMPVIWLVALFLRIACQIGLGRVRR